MTSYMAKYHSHVSLVNRYRKSIGNQLRAAAGGRTSKIPTFGSFDDKQGFNVAWPSDAYLRPLWHTWFYDTPVIKVYHVWQYWSYVLLLMHSGASRASFEKRSCSIYISYYSCCWCDVFVFGPVPSDRRPMIFL